MKQIHIPEKFPFSVKKWPFFYGYMIAVCSVMGFVVSAPGQTIGVSVFTDYLIDVLGLTRFQLSLAYTLGTIGSSFIIARVGTLLDSLGTRLIALVTSILFGLSLFYMSQVDHIALGLSGALSGLAATVVVMATITFGFLSIRFLGQGVLALASRTLLMRWFDELRGRINSLVGVFISLMFSASPLVFEVMIRNYTERGAWMVMALIIGLGFSAFVLVFIRNTPEGSGLLPDGGKHVNHEKKKAEDAASWTLKQAKRNYTFWVFNLGLSMFSLFYTAVTFHIVSIFGEAGMPRHEAISIFLPGSFIAVFINLASGALLDTRVLKYRMKYMLMVLILGLSLTGVGVLMLHSGIGKYIIILGNGIASGMFGNASTVIWPRYFGRKHLGAINGYNMSYLVFASAIGPSVFGLSYSVFGDYRSAVWICLAVMVLLILISFKADRPHLPAAEME